MPVEVVCPLGTAVVPLAQILQAVMLQSSPQQSLDKSVVRVSTCICAQCDALSVVSGIAHEARNGATDNGPISACRFLESRVAVIPEGSVLYHREAISEGLAGFDAFETFTDIGHAIL